MSFALVLIAASCDIFTLTPSTLKTAFKYFDYVIPEEKDILSTFTHDICLVRSNSKVCYAYVILQLLSTAESECDL